MVFDKKTLDFSTISFSKVQLKGTPQLSPINTHNRCLCIVQASEDNRPAESIGVMQIFLSRKEIAFEESSDLGSGGSTKPMI